jgi:hypothetical protein
MTFKQLIHSSIPTTGGVYFVTHPKYPLNVVKIGKATNIKSRLSALNTGTPEELTCVAVLTTQHVNDLESTIHNFLKQKNRNYNKKKKNEWFVFDLLSLFEMEEVCERHVVSFNVDYIDIEWVKHLFLTSYGHEQMLHNGISFDMMQISHVIQDKLEENGLSPEDAAHIIGAIKRDMVNELSKRWGIIDWLKNEHGLELKIVSEDCFEEED